MKFWHTLKFRLISVCFFLIFTLSFLLFVILYRDSRSIFMKEQTEMISHELEQVSDQLDLDICSIKKILYFISNETSIKKLLASDHPVGAASIELNKTLHNQLQLASLHPYVNKLMLASAETAIVTTGTLNGMPDDNIRLRALPYLDTLLCSTALGASGIVDEPLCYYDTPVQAIPLARSVSDSRRNSAGLLYLSISPSLISEKTERFSSLDDRFLYFRINDFYYQLVDHTFVPVAAPPVVPEETLVMGTTGKTTASLGHKTYDAVVSTLSTERWSLIRLMDSSQMPLGILMPSYLLILCSLAVTFLLLVLLIHSWVNKPIHRISRQMEQIAEDLSTPSTVEASSEEFTQISSGIESLREKLHTSFAESLLAERAKKDLEFKVLQYQINPHFISNSLNTIKWMADIQNSHGISTMAVALSNLFRNVIRTEVFITLRQELLVLNDYITIQRYRYKDIFTYEEHIADPALYDACMMKFTFQPIIENAIFHGIASSGKFGVIRLSIHSENGAVIAQIYDNGTGMTPEQIEALFTRDETQTHALNKIGIKNIDQRLKLEYGNDYGLSIESEPGEYTLVTIKFPDQRRTQRV